MRTMPAFIFQRRSDIELEAGFILAGQLIVDIRKRKKLKPSHERRIQSILAALPRLVQSGEMPEDGLVYGWPDGKRPPDADETVDNDALMTAWVKDRMVIGVRIDPRDSSERFNEADGARAEWQSYQLALPGSAPRVRGQSQEANHMSNVPIDAILALVRYLETDERKHFEARWSAGEDVSRHIYHSIKLVSDWLDTLPGVQSAAEREREFTAPLLDAFTKAGVEVQGDFADFWRWQRENDLN
jgi:hypothetical protein